jgi:hypothetical protein
LSRHHQPLTQKIRAIRRPLKAGVTQSVLKSQAVAKSLVVVAEIVVAVAIADAEAIARVIVTRRGHREQVSLKLMPS